MTPGAPLDFASSYSDSSSLDPDNQPGAEKAESAAPAMTIAVSGVAGGSGKSATALNLAAVLAMAGKKTLLVDLAFGAQPLRHREGDVLLEQPGRPSGSEVEASVTGVDDDHGAHVALGRGPRRSEKSGAEAAGQCGSTGTCLHPKRACLTSLKPNMFGKWSPVKW